MTTKVHYDVIVVGAGLIGSTLALTLARNTELNIALIERASALANTIEANQRVVALGHVASRLLDDIGVLSELGANHCHAYYKMKVWDENSNGELSFNAADSVIESAVEHQRPRLGFMVDSEHCTYLLQNAVRNERKIGAYFETELDRFDSHEAFASLRQGSTEFRAQLIVAADGAQSWLRRQAKIFANHHSYEQQGIVAKINTAELHQDTAWQRFLSTGPLAILPLSANQSSIVWSADNDYAQELMALERGEFERALSAALEAKLGEITLCSERKSFPLHSLKAERYFQRHVALVGDAAHSIHPLAGQGANLGFKDIDSLVKLIIEQLTVSDDKSALGGLALLQKYQRVRQSDNNQTDLLMSALHSAYRSDQAWWHVARGLGMNWINNSGLLKKALIKQAMGF